MMGRLFLDIDKLQTLIRRIILVGAPLATLGAPWAALSLPGCGPCAADDRIYLLAAPDAETQLLIDACRRPNAPDCLPLCRKVSGTGSVTFAHCELHKDSNGFVQVHVGQHASCPGGRRPEGLMATAGGQQRGDSVVGDWLARLAELEAASVPAFVRLREELVVHEAPADLVRSAGGAARDEVRHTGVVTALASRYGASPRPAAVPVLGPRSLEAVATENVAEGCVRETYGALFASWQAVTAGDPTVRDVFASIASDEIQHAAIAWRAREWADGLLGSQARARVREAEAAAVSQLRAEAAADVPALLCQVAGVPNVVQAHALLEGLQENLWRC